jgi:hypothetical protein
MQNQQLLFTKIIKKTKIFLLFYGLKLKKKEYDQNTNKPKRGKKYFWYSDFWSEKATNQRHKAENTFGIFIFRDFNSKKSQLSIKTSMAMSHTW